MWPQPEPKPEDPELPVWVELDWTEPLLWEGDQA